MTQTASETSASQSSLLKQLSSLESALRDVRSSLPDEEFVTQLAKLKALQLRIQAVCNRLKVVEASPGASRLQDHAETKSLVVLCRKEQAKYKGTWCTQHKNANFVGAAVCLLPSLPCFHHTAVPSLESSLHHPRNSMAGSGCSYSMSTPQQSCSIKREVTATSGYPER